MTKRNLTDRLLNSLKPAKPDARYEIMDAVVPGFGVRVTAKGQRTFILFRRFPGKPHPVRRALGVVGAMTLAEAREKARHWLKLIGEGKDPTVEEERIRRENLRRNADTFEVVAEAYLNQVVVGPDPARPRQRKGQEVARVFRKVLKPIWGPRPVSSLDRGDVLDVVQGIAAHGSAGLLAQLGKGRRPGQSRPAPGQARNVLGLIRTFFAWVIEQRVYGLEVSPCSFIRADRIIEPRSSRDRVLSDDELFAFWRAAGRLRYPYGPIYRLLLLTGLRLNEVTDAVWSEFDMRSKLWTIPAARMKGTNHRAREHVVPLSQPAIAIIEALPRFNRGPHLFSTTYGERPSWVGAKIKERLDRRMLLTLRALARRRGEDPRKVALPPWVNHDLRRTVRSELSRLRVGTDVAEAILAHVKPGIRGTYDKYDLLDEKREALARWADRVFSIAEPQPPTTDNVVRLREAS